MILKMRAIVTALAALCALLIGPAHGQDRITLRYGQIANSVHSVSSLPLAVAQRKGFLDREGIELKVVALAGAAHQVEALDHNDVDVSHTATPYLIQAALDGSDSVGFLGGPANTIYSLMAKPEIKSFEGLAGKLVAVSLPIDTISIATRMLLARHGLKEPAFRTKELGGTPARADCLGKGECDAAPLGQPDDIEFARRGYTKLGDSLEVIPVLQFNVIAARRAWLQAHADAAVRLVRAFGGAYRFMREGANRAEVAAILADVTGAPLDVAQAMLAFYYEPARGVMPRASRDQHGRNGRGDRSARPDRWPRAAAPTRATLLRPALSPGRRTAVITGARLAYPARRLRDSRIATTGGGYGGSLPQGRLRPSSTGFGEWVGVGGLRFFRIAPAGPPHPALLPDGEKE